jgi:Flp pilus assembly protein TadD
VGTRAPEAAGEEGHSPAEAWYGMGMMHRKEGEDARAIEALREAVRFDPGHGKAWYALGLLLRKHDDPAGALGAFREVLRRKPDLAVVWHHVGVLHAERGDGVRARKAFGRAVKLRPQDVHAWCGLGMASALLGDRAATEEVHRRLAELAPDVAAAFRARYVEPGPVNPAGGGAAVASHGPISGAVAALAAPPQEPAMVRPHDVAASFEAWLRSLPVPPR